MAKRHEKRHASRMDPEHCGMCWLFLNHAVATFAKKDFQRLVKEREGK